jgi:hypothetical protein
LLQSTFNIPPITNNPRIEFITSAAYWRGGCGWFERTREMVRFLNSVSDLEVTYLGKIEEVDQQKIAQLNFDVPIVAVGIKHGVLVDELQEIYKRFSESRCPADLYVVDKTETSFVLDALPTTAMKWLDTHDLISERTRKIQGQVSKEHFPLSEWEEADLLGRYDLVICIQKNECEKVSQWIGEDKVVCVPHPLEVTTRTLQNPPTRIGMVASNWHANAYGLRNFVRSAWPIVRRTGATLDVYGSVCDVIKAKVPGVCFHGFQENIEDCYKNVDIAINPVEYGAGLKIKSVEAMAHGLPLVASREGASGLEELDGESLLIAEDWDAFAMLLADLVQDHDRCTRLGQNAANYIRKNLSPEACFAPIQERLLQLRLPSTRLNDGTR